MNYVRKNMIYVLPAVMLLFFCLSSSIYASSQVQKLETKVQNAIGRYYENNFNISATRSGDVKIEGQVNSLFDKYRIFDIVDRVRGVKKIEDFLTVNTKILPDAVIKSKLIESLDLNRSILAPNRIKVKVVNGIVDLGGKVSYYREKLMAETVASWMQGVTGIVDNIKVLPPKVAVSDKNIKSILRDILNEHFPVETRVNFTLKNGIVKVKGYTSTLWAKDHIEKDFRRVKGVRDVINHIVVSPDAYPGLA